MNMENKKQYAIILMALVVAAVVSVMVGNFIQSQIQKGRQELIAATKAKIDPLEQNIAFLNNKIKEIERRQASLASQQTTSAAPDAVEAPKSSLALRTPSGKRAYTVLIDSLSAVGGMVNPGDYVDILAHMNIPNPNSGSTENVSSMVFQNIQILAVGTNLQAPGAYEAQQNARALNITFALTPQEAGLMSFLERNGKMQLILRAPAETEIQTLKTANWTTLSDYIYEKQGTELMLPGKAEVEESEKSEEVKPFIQIFQGGKEM
jgi:Flp pilus assembly protein CpaB